MPASNEDGRRDTIMVHPASSNRLIKRRVRDDGNEALFVVATGQRVSFEG